MVAPCDINELGTGDETCKLSARACDHVLAAGGNERGHGNAGKVLSGDLLARTAHAGGKRLEIASRLLGKGPEAAGGVVGHVLDAGRLERLRDRPGPPPAAHQIDPGAAQYPAPHAPWLVDDDE